MRILVTTDGSWRSLQALPHAARLAEATGGELLLTRVLDPFADCADEGTATLTEAAEVVSRRWTDEMDRTLRGMRLMGRALIGTRLQNEDIADTVLRVATEQGADAIAMSSRGSGMLRHAFLGSVALGVLSRSDLPLLLAGDQIAYPATNGEYHMLVPTDGSPGAERAVRTVAKVAAGGNVRVTLLRIYVPAIGDRGLQIECAEAADNLELLRKLFPNSDAVQCIVRPIVMLGGVDTAILNVAHEVGATGVAMSTHGHSARYHLFAGSTALAMLKRAALPILLVRTNPDRGVTTL